MATRIRRPFSFLPLARPRPTRRLALLVAVVAAATTLALVGAPAASAHDDEGQITVTAAEQVGSDRLRVEVGIVYTNDGHPAEEADVTATLTGPDGTSVGPVALERTSGSLYSAEIDVPGPGAWQVSVTSTTPTAQSGATVEVAESSETTAAPDTEPVDPTDTLVAQADEPEPVAAAPSDDADEDDDGSGTTLLLAAVLGLIVIAAVAGYVVYRRRQTPPAA